MINQKDKKKAKEKGKQNTQTAHLSYPLLYLQVILTLVMLVLGVVTLCNSKMFSWFELFLGFTLLDIALNNALFYKRNGGTFFYVLVGLLLVGLSFLEMMGF